MGYETVLDAVEAQGIAQPSWGFATAFRCPAHNDTRASASLSEGDDGRALVYCHAGCEPEAIMDGLGLEMRDLFVGEREVEEYYVYTTEDGSTPLYRVVRFKPKRFIQERYDQRNDRWIPGLNGVPRVLYHLHDVVSSSHVYVVEGEKDVERLRTLNVVATCNMGGASSWRPEYAEALRGRDVVVIPDNDEPGEKHARTILNSLDGVANSVSVKYPAVGKDISDHLDAGLDLSQLVDEPSPEEEFAPLDWDTYEAPEVQWLMEPYFPTHGRVLVFGKAGSLKSLWVMWVAAKLSRQGKKVAYFSLEMRPEQTVERLKKLRPPKQFFKVYLNYKMGDKDYLRRTIEALRGFDMIIIDSWNAAYRFTKGGTHDDQVAELDSEFFQPIIDGTGATLVLIDNTGHDIVVGFGNKIASQHARGSSAKGDKMDVTIFLNRPDEGNNYLTEIHVKKMRYDIPIPSKSVVCAPSDHEGIEFYFADSMTGEIGESMWKEEPPVPEMKSSDDLEGMTTMEKLAFIRAQRILTELDYGKEKVSGDKSGGEPDEDDLDEGTSFD